jgi:hypothetical protein
MNEAEENESKPPGPPVSLDLGDDVPDELLAKGSFGIDNVSLSCVLAVALLL